MNSSSSDLILVSDDGTLRAHFRWLKDRYHHQLFITGKAGNEAYSMSSVEGDDGFGWPTSPPIQQLSLEKLPASAAPLTVEDAEPPSNRSGTRREFPPKNVLLGVGGAGSSHWSISVQMVTLTDQPALQFELACRFKAKPDFLGSRYESNPSFFIIPGEDSIMEDEKSFVTISPKVIGGPATSRWSYQVCRKG